jgi:hypothetical protein
VSHTDWREQLKKVSVDSAEEPAEFTSHRDEKKRGPGAQVGLSKKSQSASLSNNSVETDEANLDQTDLELLEAAVSSLDGASAAILSKYSGEDPARESPSKTVSGSRTPEVAQSTESLPAHDQNLFLDAVAGIDEASWRRAKAVRPKSGATNAKNQTRLTKPSREKQLGLDLGDRTPHDAISLLHRYLEQDARMNRATLDFSYPVAIRAQVADALEQNPWAGAYECSTGSALGAERCRVALLESRHQP